MIARVSLAAGMSISDEVRGDLVVAMKAGEKDRVTTLRLVLSELQKAAKEGSADELAVLRRERKRRAEAEQAFRDGGRGELADAEAAEGLIISAYLPADAAYDHDIYQAWQTPYARGCLERVLDAVDGALTRIVGAEAAV